MKNLLDDEPLDGPHDVHIVYRPERVGVTIANNDKDEFIDTVRYLCQIWGGANSPLIPVSTSDKIVKEYAQILPGSAIDRIQGMHPYELFDPDNATVDRTKDYRNNSYGYQLAAALFRYRKQYDYQPLQTVELDASDPWRAIYAACLGLLPASPDQQLLHNGSLKADLTFDDFVTVERPVARGSLDDLIERTTSYGAMTPRTMSMLHLSYGSSGSSSIRSRGGILPQPRFAQLDAGPNVVVICSPDSVEDLALLWNLRAAYGDFRPLPIGIPIAEANSRIIARLLEEPDIARNGIPLHHIYATSASVTVDELRRVLDVSGDAGPVGIASYDEILTLGAPGGWPRNEVIIWQEGSARYVPLPQESHREIFIERGFGRLTRMHSDLDVLASSFPQGWDIRVQTPNSIFRAGVKSTSSSVSSRSRTRETVWPSRLLIARSVAARRDLELKESEPGRAGRIALSGLKGLYDLGRIAHAPLLTLLEEMAARDGFGWYKERLRQQDCEPAMPDAVAPVNDDLPERSFEEFKRTLGNNAKVTRYWLFWAEAAKLIVKGFQLQCSNCDAKQWIPVSAFVPPIVCRGCTEVMDTPFKDRELVKFKYRLSERLRRVYKQDAMGHLLAARCFYWLLGGGAYSSLVGLHPGMEVRRIGASTIEGEADVLLLTQGGDFVPTEVKRTTSGFTSGEVDKLDRLVRALRAPWSAVATCQYGKDISGNNLTSLESRDMPSGPRFILSYDALLNPHPVSTLRDDPLAWNPLDSDAVKDREDSFVKRLMSEADESSLSWHESHMLKPPRLP